MTEIEQMQAPPGWGNSNINENDYMEEDLDDVANNSAKLFERSRIKALAG